jgi:hypothetical protein
MPISSRGGERGEDQASARRKNGFMEEQNGTRWNSRVLGDFKPGVSVSTDRLDYRALEARLGNDGRPRVWPCRLFVD